MHPSPPHPLRGETLPALFASFLVLDSELNLFMPSFFDTGHSETVSPLF